MTDLSAVVRFVHLTAAMLLAGGFSFVLLIARPAVTDRQGFRQNELPDFCPATAHDRSLLLAGDFSIGFARPLDPDRQRERRLDWNSLQLRCDSSRSPRKLSTAGSGWRAWFIALLLAVFFSSRNRADKMRFGFSVSLWRLPSQRSLLVALAFAGHASAAEGSAFVLQVSADALHLLAAASGWVVLLPLAFLLRLQSQTDRRRFVCRADRHAAFFRTGVGKRRVANRQRRVQCLESRRRFCAVVRHRLWQFVAAQARPPAPPARGRCDESIAAQAENPRSIVEPDWKKLRFI